jgi:hypothetical protein
LRQARGNFRMTELVDKKANTLVANPVFGSVCGGKFDDHSVAGLPPPSYKWKDAELEGDHFDPAVHLALEPPTHIKDMDFKDVPFPFSESEKKVLCHLAYTRPFRVLSEAGVKLARQEAEKNMNRLAHQDARSACYLRGLGHVSNFHREFAYCPEVLSLLSELSRDSLGVHSMPFNISHTNIGKIGAGRPVDKWHTDSTDYVLVIMLSDQTDMVGGDLRVLQMPDASNDASNISTFQRLQRDGVPEELIETVKYAKAGYGIFMQGCKILHTVSEVMSAREPRWSLVNSFKSTRVFGQPDKTRYTLFAEDEGADIATVDFARHKAWRVGAQLDFIRNNAAYDSTKLTPADISEILRNAAKELQFAADLIDKKADDHTKWVD